MLNQVDFGCSAGFEISFVPSVASYHCSMNLSTQPHAPSLNRWLGLYQPLSWWAFFLCFFSIIPVVFIGCEPRYDTEMISLSLVQILAHGPGSEGDNHLFHAKQLATGWGVFKANREVANQEVRIKFKFMYI